MFSCFSVTGALSGLLAGLFYLMPGLLRTVLITSLGSVIGAGVLQDLLRPTFAAWGPLAVINDLLFTANGLTTHGALTLFILIAVITLLWARKGKAIQASIKRLPPKGRRALRISTILLLIFILLVLPQILGLFLSEVLTIVGLYVLLGLGLNIVVGFAGLLDLGYVAFFAIGAYSYGSIDLPGIGVFQFHLLGSASLCDRYGNHCGGPPGRPGLEDAGRLSCDYDVGVWRDHPDSGSFGLLAALVGWSTRDRKNRKGIDWRRRICHPSTDLLPHSCRLFAGHFHLVATQKFSPGPGLEGLARG